jgi:hypothetical protein
MPGFLQKAGQVVAPPHENKIQEAVPKIFSTLRYGVTEKTGY